MISFIFLLREKIGTSLVYALPLGLNEYSDGDLVMSKELKTPKDLCKASIKISQHVLKRVGFDGTVLNEGDELSFVVFHRHVFELSRE